MKASGYRDSVLWPCVAIGWLGLAYALLARYAFDAFPYSGDEYSIVLQAEIFARGLLHAHAPANADLLRVDHVVIDQWVRSKYPPGASLLLAVGVRAGVPWLVGPVEGVVTLCLAWHTARQELGAACAWVTLVILGLSPLFVFHSATFFSHPASTMWLALAFAAVSGWTRTQRDAWLVVLSVALGWAFITRPSDAAFFGLALLVLRSRRLIVACLLGGAPFVAGYLWYQDRQFGSPFTDGYHAYEPTFRAIYGQAAAVHPISLETLLSPRQQFLHLDVLRALVIDWTVAGSSLLALVGAYAIGPSHPARSMRNVSVAVSVVLIVGLLPMVADPDDGARPRYQSTMLLTIAFLAGPGWLALRETLAGHLGTRRTRAVAATAMAFAPVQLAAFLMQRLPSQWQREGLYEAVGRAKIDHGVVVVRATYPTRFARNGAFFDRPVLYVSVPPDLTVDQVSRRFPGRDVYEATEGHPWKVSSFEPPHDE